jgi:hypothetical protein
MEQQHQTGGPKNPRLAPGMTRRGFVGMVSATLAAQWFTEIPRSAWAESGKMFLTPGYLRGSEVIAGSPDLLMDLNWHNEAFFERVRQVIPEELPLEIVSSADLGGPELAEGSARLWVHGMLPPDDVHFDREVDAIDLEIVTVPEPGVGPYRFLAWTYERDPVVNVSGATSCIVPIGADSTFELRLRVHRVGSGAEPSARKRDGDPTSAYRDGMTEVEHEFSAQLSASDQYRRPKLRAGTYVFPLSMAASESMPLPANRDWLVPRDLLFLMFSVEPL